MPMGLNLESAFQMGPTLFQPITGQHFKVHIFRGLSRGVRIWDGIRSGLKKGVLFWDGTLKCWPVIG